MKAEGKKTLSLEIMDKIKDMIRNGDIKPGGILPSERELSTKFGVSRPPIREAFHALRALGIIDIHAGGGAYLRKEVPIISEHFKTKAMLAKYTTIDLVEARTIIEKETVALAIKRANEKDLEDIKFFLDKGKECYETDTETFLEYDFSFHKSIAIASKNFVLVEMLESTRTLLLNINLFNIIEPGHLARSVKAHEQIYNAIASKDTIAGKRLMKEHIKTVTTGVDYFTKSM